MKPLVEGLDYTLADGELRINEGIKCIPSKMFMNRKDITFVILPSSLEIIKEYAFACTNISGTLNIPDSVKYIHDYAFSYVPIIKLIIGKKVVYIGRYSFNTDNYIDIQYSGNNLKHVDLSAFYNFKNPTDRERYINKLNLTGIRLNYCNDCDKDKYTFENGLLKIHEGVESIDNFSDLKDLCTEIYIPDSVLFIQEEAFSNFTKLEKIRFSNNLLGIYSLAFDNCNSIKHEIILPDSLCYLKYNSFSNKYSHLTERISIPYNTNVFILDNSQLEKYQIRENSVENINNDRNYYAIDINKLLDEERMLLEQYNLLPENINANIKINKKISNDQANIIKESINKFISSKDYNEQTQIFYIKEELNLKLIDVSDMHETINILFDKNQINTIYLFISYGYDYLNNSMISRAIINNMYEMIDVLILIGADINEIGTIDMTPLSIACQKGDLKLVEKLIEKGAAIKKVDKYNKSAIDYAMENNHQEIIDLISNYNTHDVSPAEEDLERVRLLLNS